MKVCNRFISCILCFWEIAQLLYFIYNKFDFIVTEIYHFSLVSNMSHLSGIYFNLRTFPAVYSFVEKLPYVTKAAC